MASPPVISALSIKPINQNTNTGTPDEWNVNQTRQLEKKKQTTKDLLTKEIINVLAPPAAGRIGQAALRSTMRTRSPPPFRD